MLLAVRLGALLIPVNDGLIGDTVLVVQGLQNIPPTFVRRKELRCEMESDLHYLRERFHNPGIFVAVHLYRVDERNLRLRIVAERLEDFRKSLQRRDKSGQQRQTQ